MQCLKCGRKIQDGQVFCEGCLQVMQAYPVKPGTAIQLPSNREKQEEKRKTARRALSPVEQNVLLRVAIRRLRRVALVLFLLLGATAAALIYILMKKPEILNFVR